MHRRNFLSYALLAMGALPFIKAANRILIEPQPEAINYWAMVHDYLKASDGSHFSCEWPHCPQFCYCSGIETSPYYVSS
jgi:hypothetical protein